MENEIRDHSKWLEVILDHTPALIFFKDTKNNFILVNKAIADAHNMTKVEVSGKNVSELYPKQAQTYWEEDLEVIKSGKPKANIEATWEIPGGVRWLSTSKIPVKDDNNNTIGIVGFSTDITERRRAEIDLRREKELTESLINNMPCIALIMKKETREIIVSNRKAKEAGAVPGKKCYNTWYQFSEPCPWCLAPEAWKTSKSQNLEVTNEDKIWDTHWIPMKDDLYLHYAFDVTESRRAEITIRESEEKYRQLIATTKEAVMVFEADTTQFIEVNQACEQLYGYSRKEFLCLKHSNITDESEKSQFSINEALNGDLQFIPIRNHKKKDGTIFPVEISASKFKIGGHQVLCSFIRDITEKKKNRKNTNGT